MFIEYDGSGKLLKEIDWQRGEDSEILVKFLCPDCYEEGLTDPLDRKEILELMRALWEKDCLFTHAECKKCNHTTEVLDLYYLLGAKIREQATINAKGV